MMRQALMRPLDVANGPGIRVSLFVSGCRHACPGCFNDIFQDFSYGTPWSSKLEQALVAALDAPLITGLSLLGGEPFQNTEGLLPLLRRLRDHWEEQGLQRDVWVWSGYTFEELLQDPEKRALLSLCDVLVDGRFLLEEKNLSLPFCGSMNQRVLDVELSLQQQKPVLIGPL
ncbi:Ribonucleotide reductase of class III (anaerobic), activating protein [Clostridiaceae bacterium JG1575]|nr:Ribonucleotide reductase of class III (anaerobic), activating protein [Clostridiaceae bacterium JG1575]